MRGHVAGKLGQWLRASSAWHPSKQVLPQSWQPLLWAERSDQWAPTAVSRALLFEPFTNRKKTYHVWNFCSFPPNMLLPPSPPAQLTAIPSFHCSAQTLGVLPFSFLTLSCNLSGNPVDVTRNVHPEFGFYFRPYLSSIISFSDQCNSLLRWDFLLSCLVPVYCHSGVGQ